MLGTVLAPHRRGPVPPSTLCGPRGWPPRSVRLHDSASPAGPARWPGSAQTAAGDDGVRGVDAIARVGAFQAKEPPRPAWPKPTRGVLAAPTRRIWKPADRLSTRRAGAVRAAMPPLATLPPRIPRYPAVGRRS